MPESGHCRRYNLTLTKGTIAHRVLPRVAPLLSGRRVDVPCEGLPSSERDDAGEVIGWGSSRGTT